MPSSPDALSSLSVFVAIPCLTDPSLHTTMSLLDTQEACGQYGIKVDFGFVTCSLVHHARSLLANVFIGRTEFNRLFWIDADMKWSPVDFVKVLNHTRTHDCVAGVYPRRREPPGYFVNFVNPDADPDEDGLIEIEATGMGFSCVRRGVMEHLAALAPKLKHGQDAEPSPAIFRQDDDGTSVRGEDYAFWSDCRDAGYKIFADCTLNIGHVGTKIYQCRALSSPR